MRPLLLGALVALAVSPGIAAEAQIGRDADRTGLWERGGIVLDGFRNLYQFAVVPDPSDLSFPYRAFFFGWSAADGNPGVPGYDAIFTARGRSLTGGFDAYRGGGTWGASDRRGGGIESWTPIVWAQDLPYDAIHNGDPTVVRVGRRWFMAYSSNGPNDDGIPYGAPGDSDGDLDCIMGATSGDGIHWRKSQAPILVHDGDRGTPPVPTGDAHSFGSYLRPSLLYERGRFRLWFDY